jgi:hypothetical protein
VQLEQVGNLAAEDAQRGELQIGQMAGLAVEHAETAERGAFGGEERGAGVKADAVLGGDEWVVGETEVTRGVGHDHEVERLVEGVGAEGLVARRLLRLHADAGLEPLAVAVDDGHESDGSAADLRGELGEIVETLIGSTVENVVFGECVEAIGFVEGESGFHGVGKSEAAGGGREEKEKEKEKEEEGGAGRGFWG